MSDPADKRVTTTKGDPAPGTEPGPAPEPIDSKTGQHGAYWVLTEEERAKGFVRPVRMSYVHVGTDPQRDGPVLFKLGEGGCGGLTTMGKAIAETFAREPAFYGSTFCVACRAHIPVAEFVWDGTDELVGS